MITISLLFSCKANKSQDKTLDESLYVAYEKMSNLDKIPTHEWFRKTYIIFKKDSVFIEESPIIIENEKDTFSSASDGGFYYYKGTKIENNGKVEINTILTSCDYCIPMYMRLKDGTLKAAKNEKHFSAIRIENGLNINGNIFKKTSREKAKGEIVN
ncbi:MAG: hypothetical protein PW786_14160 [Arachidicoccus sp.]|nr:hypothetical protein [Arachidicoccus sp.]